MHPSFFLDAVDEQALLHPDALAFANSLGESMTYAQLKRASDALACALVTDERVLPDQPVMVYGHKSPYMLACMLGCAKAGHAYVAVDTAFPAGRVRDIAGQLGAPLLLDTTREGIAEVDEACAGRVDLAAIERMATCAPTSSQVDALPGLAPDDTLYILFTSGSTGTPKGIEVPIRCMDNFCRWIRATYPDPAPQTFVNRVPFSFDVSLTDMALGLTTGGTLFALERDHETSMAATFKALASCGANWWISTPSFVEMCLADPAFCRDLMPSLHTVFLAGEVLRPSTVEALWARFEGLRVINAYGPTESTNVVTAAVITPEMMEGGKPLPIGYAKAGTELAILDPVTLERVPEGQPGELFIIGDTVAKGYYGRPELTEAAFHSCPEELAQGRASFRTGDECTCENGLFYYHGRLDLQVKLHGYRIELGDIEATLCELDQVSLAAVLPVWRDGAISHLAAYVVPADTSAPLGLALTRALKAELSARLPAYMVPRAFKYLDELPINVNGKVDRKALAAKGDA